MYRNFFKRIIDFTLALIALIVLSPLMLVVAIVTAIKMKGNPFFVQPRPGKNEKIFKLIKFRSMTEEKDENGNYIPATLKISFTHPAVNKKLCTYLKAKQLQENIENNKYNFNEEQQNEAYQALESDMEEIKNHLLDDNMIVKKGSNRISVKVFPQ